MTNQLTGRVIRKLNLHQMQKVWAQFRKKLTNKCNLFEEIFDNFLCKEGINATSWQVWVSPFLPTHILLLKKCIYIVAWNINLYLFKLSNTLTSYIWLSMIEIWYQMKCFKMIKIFNTKYCYYSGMERNACTVTNF